MPVFNMQGRIIANGATAEVEDKHLGRIARTDYDLADRPCQTELKETATGKVLYRTLLKYDKFSNLEQFTEKIGDEIHTSKYAYDRDNRVTEIQYDGAAQKVVYTYDDLGRVTARTADCGNAAGKLTSTYEYVDGAYGTNSTTPLVKKITQNGISFEYTYDTRGNIVSEKRGNLTTTYAYDALGQLIRVNDPHENETWVYNYDRGGNILSKVKYAYTTGTVGTALETIPYVYGDANWKDKLTAYNGTAITYDAIGNPLNNGSWTYEWAVGRQLKKMSKPDKEIEFKYDFNGLRTQKIVTENGVTTTTNYLLHGKLVTHMTVGNDKLHFFYDNSSRPAKVDFNGTIYTYLHNLQGDIVGILDNTGNLVVEYKYDAWGKLLSTTGSLADTLGIRNPFRYRGYVYDEESGLYYLRSRYYTAHWNRFINSDEAFLAHNHFTYCANAPIHLKDEDGTLWQGAVHHLVQLDIQRRIPGMIREVSVIKATGGNGRIDLVLWQTGECWEIKPSHLYLAGCAQLTNYIRGEVIDDRWDYSLTPRRGRSIPRRTIKTDEMIINYWYAGNGVILYDYIKYKKAIIPVPAYSPATEPVLEKEPVLLPNAVKPKYTIAEVPTCPFDFYAFEYDPGLLFAELFQVIIYGLA